MVDLYKYKVYCETESAWVTAWLENGLTVCPNNNTHTISSGSISVIAQNLDDGPISSDGRPIIRADSRPVGYYTYFTMAGDSEAGIGEGKKMWWDFSNDDDIVTTSGVVPDGYKMKRLKVSFADSIYIKEGCNYFFGALKGSYIHFMIVCPAGNYYLNRDGSPAYASEDVIVVRYANHHFFCGDCPMGDELNTEGCAESAMPSDYELWIEIYVPEEDNSSYGHAELEMYRQRTYLLPGESI